jgi:hypothetical protein
MERRALSRADSPRTIPEWFVSPWFYILMALAVGVIAAQLVTGHLAPRWIKALVGLVFLFGLFRLPLYGAVCFFLIAFPFPTYVFLGNTNIIFVAMMLAIWAIKVRLGREPVPPKTYLDFAAGAYILVHVLSFFNVSTKSNLFSGIFQLQFLGLAVGLYFLVAKVLRTEQHLRIALKSLAVTSLLVSITGVMEFFVPTLRLIPDWFISAGPSGLRFAEGGRVGGVFRFHGLLADFCAIMFMLQAYLFVRSKSVTARAFYAALMVAGVFQIFVTANRGGFIIWAIGLVYLVWIGRGGLTVRRVVVALPILLAAGVALEAATAKYGRVITLFQRLLTTQVERGVPDTRIEVWANVLREIPQHLWIGHGPYYDLLGGRSALGRQWPHSAYLMYLWTTGILGLLVFLWILGKTLVKSYPGGKLRLGRVSFAHGAMAVAHVQVLQFALAQVRDEHQRGNVYPFLMWALIGLAVAARRIWKEEDSGIRPPRGEAPPGKLPAS